MIDTRRTGDRGHEPIQPDSGGGRLAPTGPGARVARAGEVGGRQRIPTVRQLAGLLVNGILTLPRNYRRGMFLDIVV
ncbi:hypothetical protein [Azospirillum halopraeferens]|uniref:hypothetical protein n=1 Tax=Azospirillum halopraeferens TaxID=34010 RepID=UPI000426E7D6|nr:hypothetical protein [Azospirillum halopraeferens]